MKPERIPEIEQKSKRLLPTGPNGGRQPLSLCSTQKDNASGHYHLQNLNSSSPPMIDHDLFRAGVTWDGVGCNCCPSTGVQPFDVELCLVGWGVRPDWFIAGGLWNLYLPQSLHMTSNPLSDFDVG